MINNEWSSIPILLSCHPEAGLHVLAKGALIPLNGKTATNGPTQEIQREHTRGKARSRDASAGRRRLWDNAQVEHRTAGVQAHPFQLLAGAVCSKEARSQSGRGQGVTYLLSPYKAL